MDIYNGHQYANALQHAQRGYSRGIAYYKILQNRFNNLMKIAEQDSLSAGYTRFAQQMNTRLEKQSIEAVLSPDKLKQFSAAITQLSSEIIQGHAASISNILDANQGRTKITSKNYLKNYSARVKEAFMQSVITEDYRKKVLSLYRTIFNRGEIQDQPTINALYGFLRRQIIADMLSEKQQTKITNSLSGYTSLFIGDFREEFGENALNSLYKDIAARAGQIAGTTGVQTGIDIIVGPGAKKLNEKELVSIVQRLDNLSGQVTATADGIAEIGFFGGQVKSWGVPEGNIPNDRTYRSIGDRSNLHSYYGFNVGRQDDVDFKRGWHNSASVIGKHITEVLGKANVFYIAQDKFYWTADLIQTFKNANYFLTFYYKRKTLPDRSYQFTYPGTADVVWQKQMYKNMYKLKRRS